MSDALLRMPAAQLRETWQCRVLQHAKDRAFYVMLAALCAEYHVGVKILLSAAHPGFSDIKPPLLAGYATIAPDGSIWCYLIDEERNLKAVGVYQNEHKLAYEMRKLADKLKLNDRERLDMFTVVEKWIVQDQRIDEHGRRKVLH